MTQQTVKTENFSYTLVLRQNTMHSNVNLTLSGHVWRLLCGVSNWSEQLAVHINDRNWPYFWKMNWTTLVPGKVLKSGRTLWFESKTHPFISQLTPPNLLSMPFPTSVSKERSLGQRTSCLRLSGPRTRCRMMRKSPPVSELPDPSLWEVNDGISSIRMLCDLQ